MGCLGLELSNGPVMAFLNGGFMQVRKPSWWQLYMLLPILPAVVLLEQLHPLPGFSTGEVDGGILVLIFVALVGWIQVHVGLIER